MVRANQTRHREHSGVCQVFQPDRQKNLPRDRIWEGHNDTSSGLATTTTTTTPGNKALFRVRVLPTMVPHLSHILALLLGKLVTRKHTVHIATYATCIDTVCIKRSTKVRRCVGLQVEDVCYVEQTSILKNNSIALPYLERERDCGTKYWEYDTPTLHHQQYLKTC